jgi:hypothetical protein
VYVDSYIKAIYVFKNLYVFFKKIKNKKIKTEKEKTKLNYVIVMYKLTNSFSMNNKKSIPIHINVSQIVLISYL